MPVSIRSFPGVPIERTLRGSMLSLQIGKSCVLPSVITLQRSTQQVHGQNFSKEPGMGSQFRGLHNPALGINRALIDQVAVYLASADRGQAGLPKFIYLSSGVCAAVVDGWSQIGFGNVDYEFAVFCHQPVTVLAAADTDAQHGRLEGDGMDEVDGDDVAVTIAAHGDQNDWEFRKLVDPLKNGYFMFHEWSLFHHLVPLGIHVGSALPSGYGCRCKSFYT